MNALDELLIGNIRQQIKDILKLINYSMVNGKFSLNHLLKTDKMIEFIVQRLIENCSFTYLIQVFVYVSDLFQESFQAQ